MEKMSVEELKRCVEELLRVVEKSDVYVITFESKSWSDRAVYSKSIEGRKIEDEDLKSYVESLANFAYPEDEYVIVKFIAVVPDGVMAQMKRDIYNQYGNWVGEELWYQEITTIAEMALKNVRKTEKSLKPAIQKAIERLTTLLE